MALTKKENKINTYRVKTFKKFSAKNGCPGEIAFVTYRFQLDIITAT